MKRQLGRYKLFTAAIVFYIAGACFYGWFEYNQAKSIGLKALDERLLSTVSLAESLLQQKLRDNIAGQKPITPNEDYLLALELQALADDMGVAYIYSIIKTDGRFFFISSNPTPDELNTSSKSYETAFLTPYPDFPSELDEVFKTGELSYSQYEDRWGHFRSLFFPFKDLNNITYVIGVDVAISSLTTLAYKSLLKALAYSLFLALIVFPLVCAYLRTIRQAYVQKLEAVGQHALTGLPNQRCLEEKLTNSSDDHLLLVEIENFDHVASVLGVAATDALILRLVYKLTEIKAPKIEFGEWFHLADDRFGLFSTHSFSESEIKVITSAVFQALTHASDALELDKQVPLVIRMGAVTNQQNALMFAGMALIHAKKTNQSFVNYDPSLNLPKYFQRYINTFNLLSDALRNDRVTVFFQPILDVSSSQIVKYEALARIVDENGDPVSSPDQFMPIAYQSRLCHKLTRVVVDKVLDAIKPTQHIVSVNLSVKDLFDQKTREYLIHRIRASHLGEQIEFELLEQQAIVNYATAAAYIRQLKSCVSAVGMDDLGKLYSNFDRLFALPLDFVKIDGMVVEAMERDSDASTVIEGIVSFARHKGIHVIAEHCYSQNVCDMMVLMNVDLLQGFYIGKPASTFAIQALEEKAV
ncbi:MAG: EAL domain-containing protein [Cellvibrionaceae bacterium]